MESPTMACVAVVEDTARWPTQMYEVQNVNCQNFNNTNYNQAWGSPQYGESRRRNMRGGKPHHHVDRRRQQQQASWSPECGPASASPQWQPQPAPPCQPADTSFSGFQEPQGPVGVNLQGLPPTLCRQNFLEAMLDQAGLANDTMGCVLGEEQDTGKAVIYLASYNAAVKCVQHFGGRRWDNAGPPVTAQVAEGQGQNNAPAESGANPANSRVNNTTNKTRKQRGSKNIMMEQEQFNNNIPPAGAWSLPQPAIALPIMAMQGYHKGSDLSHQLAPEAEQASTGSYSPKVCWADLDDEEEKENDLSEGLEGSTSAGSTGRASKDTTGESFFFGCDVDTDDGF